MKTNVAVVKRTSQRQIAKNMKTAEHRLTNLLPVSRAANFIPRVRSTMTSVGGTRRIMAKTGLRAGFSQAQIEGIQMPRARAAEMNDCRTTIDILVGLLVECGDLEVPKLLKITKEATNRIRRAGEDPTRS